MRVLRPSRPDDIPRLRILWALAFGDGEDYVNHFFHSYYQPHHILVLEEDGVVQAMTTWFGSTLCLPDKPTFRCAYLYAVATHPDCRGRGLAGALLDYCARFLRETFHFDALTTVPARPDLHIFFGNNGFRECFVQRETVYTRAELPPRQEGALRPISAAEYRALREKHLADTPHIDLDIEGISYQAGASILSGGNLYRLDGREAAILALEGDGEGNFYLKELLGDAEGTERALSLLPSVSDGARYFVREPGGTWQFGMLKWLDAAQAAHWDWSTTAYLGFAFD